MYSIDPPPPKPPSPKSRMLTALIFMAVSAAIIVISLVRANSAAETVVMVEQLHPLTIASLADTQPGQTVLVEGRISQSTPTQFHQFVAFLHEAKTKLDWHVSEAVTPPLQLDCADGTLEIVNHDYLLDGQTLAESWQPVQPFPNERYRGIVQGSPIVVVGRVVRDQNRLGIEAKLVAVGHKAEYLAGQRAAATWDNNLVYGLFLLLIATGTFLGYWQQVRQAQRERSDTNTT